MSRLRLLLCIYHLRIYSRADEGVNSFDMETYRVYPMKTVECKEIDG